MRELKIPYDAHNGRNNSGRGQVAVHSSKARFRVVMWGRRGGKTTCALAEALQAALEPGGSGDLIWYVAHTYKQGKAIAWNDLLKLIPPEIILRKNETELFFELINHRRIEIKGADQDPHALRGRGRMRLVILDEYAYMKESIWPEIIFPMLADSGGRALFIGTPSGQNHFYDLYLKAKTEEDWESWLFYTSDNPYIPLKEIEIARKNLPDKTFRQEYMAEALDYGGLIWPMFEPEFHIIDAFEPVVGQYVFLRSTDWGYVHPCATLYGAVADGTLTIFDEYWEDQNIIASEVARNIKAKYDLPFLINYGGHDFKRKDGGTGASAWDYFNSEGVYITNWDASPGSVEAGCNKVGELLRIDENGKSRLYIVKKCKRLIYEMQRYRMDEAFTSDENRKRPEKPLKKEDDCCDALRGVCVMNPEYLDDRDDERTDDFYRRLAEQA